MSVFKEKDLDDNDHEEEDFHVRKFALIFDPPTLVVEYIDESSQKNFVRLGFKDESIIFMFSIHISRNF